MEMNSENNQRTFVLKAYLKSKKFWKPALAISIGALAGLLFYVFVGCSSGSCAITSNPYMSMLWGGIMGFFLVSSPCSGGSCSRN